MNPRAFLEFAKEILNNNSEPAWRTAVSRSYYALHNCMSDFLVNQGFSLPKQSVRHKKVYEYLHNCGIQDIRDMAEHLDYLRTERNLADYEMANDNFSDKNKAMLSYHRAASTYSEFQEYITAKKNRDQISKGISIHIEKTRGQSR